VLAGPASVVALECGWIVTEVGRQPWIVWQVMRVRDAVTDAPNIRWGYYLLLAVYSGMALFAFIVLRRLARVPLPAEIRESA
jgi:cytochrome d ubiquinol oxidase subunit I